MARDLTELEDDILRYNELLKRADELEKDIPFRRTGLRKAPEVPSKSIAKGRKKAKVERKERKVKKQKVKPKPEVVEDKPSSRTRSRRRCVTRSQTVKVEPVEKVADEEDEEEEEEEKIVKRKKPKLDFSESLRDQPISKDVKASPRPKYSVKPPAPKKEHLPPTFLKSKVRSYEDYLSINSSYSDLVKAVKEDGGKSVHFGMSLNLLPKNISYEKKRFAYEHSSELDRLLDRRLSFSDDIDKFFRSLSGESKVAAVPLV